MKFWAGVLASLLVFAPRAEPGPVQYEVITRTIILYPEEYSPPVEEDDYDIIEAERQGLCLWEFMNRRGMDITLENVLVSGEWTDINGGACFLIGEDDEPAGLE